MRKEFSTPWHSIEYSGKNDKQIMEFCPVARDPEDIKANLIIETPEGEKLCSVGDIVLKTSEGLFYVRSKKEIEDIIEGSLSGKL